MKLFITGRPGIGKTTVLMKTIELIRERGYVIGGMITLEERQKGTRVGFNVIDLMSGEKGVLAVAREPGEPRIGKYHVRLNEFERIGIKALRRAVQEADVVACDEIGPMELLSSKFVKIVYNILRSEKPLIGVVHWKARHPLVLDIKSSYRIYKVTIDNRNKLPNFLATQILKNIEGRDT